MSWEIIFAQEALLPSLISKINWCPPSEGFFETSIFTTSLIFDNE